MSAGKRFIGPAKKLLRNVSITKRSNKTRGQEELSHLANPVCEVAPIRNMKEMQGPPDWPLIGNFYTYIKKENKGRLHEVQVELHKKYGTLFREELGFRTHIHISSPTLIEKVFRMQGKHPVRPPFSSWRNYRYLRGKPMGLLTAEGTDWQRIRTTISKRMLIPKAISNYASDLNEVSTELIDRIRLLKREMPNEDLAKKLPNELYKWAMESIGTILFETRMGCLGENMPDDVQTFINAIDKMMSSSLIMIIGDNIHQKLNTSLWKRHVDAWDTLFLITEKYVNNRLQEIQDKVEELDNTKPEEISPFLSHLLSTGEMSKETLYANATECMLGGVDTTSNTLSFVLYLLSQHPEVQEKLYREVTKAVGAKNPSWEEIKSIRYLRNVVKETLRLYPVIPMNVRQISEDVIVDGYRIPKDTLFVLNNYVASRDENVFENASQFTPERWDEDKLPHFASLPFGYGSRSCVGRRIAELEIYLITVRMLQNFELKPVEGMTMKTFHRTVLTPGESLPIQFVDR